MKKPPFPRPVAAPVASPRKADAPLRRAMPTREAARYLGLSPSMLRKLRLKGPQDPGLQGPQYIKVGPNLRLYEVAELDRWLDARRAPSAA